MTKSFIVPDTYFEIKRYTAYKGYQWTIVVYTNDSTSYPSGANDKWVFDTVSPVSKALSRPVSSSVTYSI